MITIHTNNNDNDNNDNHNNDDNNTNKLIMTLNMSLRWSRVSSPQFSYWLGQAGIVHIGFGQRVLTVVCEIREKITTSAGGRVQGPSPPAPSGRPRRGGRQSCV